MIIAMQSDSILTNPNALLRAIVGCLDQLLSDPVPSEAASAFNLKGPATISISDYLASTCCVIEGYLSI